MSDFWNGTAGQRWVRSADRYDRQLAAYSQQVLLRARLQAGERVLDIGCGTGPLTIAARKKLGPTGTATGIDISGRMIKRARRDLEASGLGNVEFLRADAQTHRLGTSQFDVAVSRFGVMFFEEPVDAFANVARAVRPGGRLVFTCWQSPEANPWLTIQRQATEALLDLPGIDPDAPGPFSMAATGRTLEILRQAGWIGAAASPLVGRIHIGGPGTVEEAVRFVMATGAVATGLEGRKKKRVAKVEAALTEALAPHHDGTGVSLPSGAWLVEARR